MLANQSASFLLLMRFYTILVTYNDSQVNNQRHKYHPLTVQYHNDSEDDHRSGCRNVSHSVTNSSSVQNYTHPDDHTRQTTDTPGFKPFTMKVLFSTAFQVTGVTIATISALFCF